MEVNKNHIEREDDFASRPRNLKELAARYNCTPKTFRRWLNKAKLDLGVKLGYYFSPRQVKIILNHMSTPFVWLAVVTAVSVFGTDLHAGLDGRLAVAEAKLVAVKI